MCRIALDRQVRCKGKGDRLQERLHTQRIIRPANNFDPCIPATSYAPPLYHFLCELNAKFARQLSLEIIDTLLAPFAFFDDNRDTLRQFRWPT